MGGTRAGWIAGAVLGAVLLVSGAAKLADRGWRPNAVALGTPGWAIPSLPWVELGLGGVLVAGLGRPWSAAAAALLIVAFSLLLAANLARGRRVPCACFGSRSRRPISALDLVRNGALLALAVIAIVA